jgi:hypothetical protein
MATLSQNNTLHTGGETAVVRARQRVPSPAPPPFVEVMTHPPAGRPALPEQACWLDVPDC